MPNVKRLFLLEKVEKGQVLHCCVGRSMSERINKTLLSRLGGEAAVRAVVDSFYDRLRADKSITFFFEGIEMSLMKIHQVEFFTIAFTGFPEGVDVGEIMIEAHRRLFQIQGLNEEHFDIIAGHLVATLENYSVPPELINEAVGVVVPLRAAFELGAQIYGVGFKLADGDKDEENVDDCLSLTLLEKLGGTSSVKAAVDQLYSRIMGDPGISYFFVGVDMKWMKRHLIAFMKMAFAAAIPRDLDVIAFLRRRHSRLFEDGLTGKHFDAVAMHFIDGLNFLGVSKALIDEAVEIVAPLRAAFEENSE